jgi:hypothetical protein
MWNAKAICWAIRGQPGIPLLHFDDRLNEIYARSFRTGLPTAIRGEEHPVLLLAQDFVKP